MDDVELCDRPVVYKSYPFNHNIEYEEDKTTHYYYTRVNGQYRIIDVERCTNRDFMMWVDLGMPDRTCIGKSSPMRTEDLLWMRDVCDKFGIDPLDTEQRDVVFKMLASQIPGRRFW